VDNIDVLKLKEMTDRVLCARCGSVVASNPLQVVECERIGYKCKVCGYVKTVTQKEKLRLFLELQRKLRNK